MSEIISFSFEGGDANHNQLNFYDGSRFIYAASRLVSHIERFRATGEVKTKVGLDYTDVLLNVPRKGSFEFEIVLGSHIAYELTYNVPLKALLSYAWEKNICRCFRKNR